MSKKKLSKSKKERLMIAGIVLSVAVCGYCFLSDFRSAVSDSKEALESESTLGSILTSFEEVGKYAGDITSDIKSEASGEIAEASENRVEENSEESTNAYASNATGSGTVVRVVDGDTYVLNINGEEQKVRLIGVDTPESVAPSDYYKDNTEEGKEVSDIVKEKIQTGDTLSIEYDVQTTDKYGRILAYLYFEDGIMVQEWLLGNGYAQCMTVQPNSKYAEYFAEIQHQAAENKVGLWNGFFEEKEGNES